MNDLLIVAMVLLGAAALLWTSRHPLRTIVPAYAFLVPIGGVFALRVPLPSPFNTLSSVAGALAIGATALHLLRGKRGRIPSLPVGVWLLFVGWSALTFLWARDPKLVMSELILALPLVLLLVLIGMLPATRADLGRLRDAIVASGVAVGGYAMLLTLSGAALPSHGFSARFSLNSGDTNPNQLAASLLLPFVLSLDLALEPTALSAPTWRRAFGWVGALLSAYAIALSGSRGGAIATMVGLVVTLGIAARWKPWLRDRVRRAVRATVVGAIALVALGALSIALFPQSGLTSLFSGTPLQRLVRTESSSGRAEIWTTGALACTRYCGAGAGFGNFTRVFRESVAFSNITRNVGLERPGHNLYLEIGVETGVVGLVLFGLAIVAEWRTLRLRRSFPVAAGLAGAIVALRVADVFEGFLWFKHTWLPFLVIRVFEAAADAAEHEEARAIASERAEASRP